MDAVVVAFLKRRPDLFAPTPPITREIVAFPTPRAYARVSYILQHEGLNSVELAESVAGMIGPGAASEFMAFCENIDRLPDPIDVMMGKVKFPRQADVAIATSVAITQVLLKGSQYNDAYFKHSCSWPAEYVVGLQFPVIKDMTPKWRGDNGWGMASVAAKYGEWFDTFADMIGRAEQ
uniref:Uncharacterized protein n=1 Tax=viral metagenome TaxID=1070528 RepID=A0A6M3K957_9ZZZZ